jgi:hypothetical protein
MCDAWNVAKQGENYIDKEICTSVTPCCNGNRREEDCEDEETDVNGAHDDDRCLMCVE